MTPLSEILERFNRKERNLLIRHILGHNVKKLQLSEKFRRDLAEKLQIKAGIPEDAWWATDYHIAWIAGAVGLFALHCPPAGHLDEGSLLLHEIEGPEAVAEITSPTVSGHPWTNRPLKLAGDRRLIEGGQEDVDLLISYEDATTHQNELILIEVKGDSSFGNNQLKSKIVRAASARDFYHELCKGEHLEVNFHFALMSPREPRRLTAEWPDWALRNRKIPWIELPFAADLLMVSRCDKSGLRQRNGTQWAVFKTSETEE
jgi:hypothetical protein